MIIAYHEKHAVICIEPSQYQDLYHKLGNDNQILAQAHAQALEQVLEQSPCSYAIADQFGKVSLLQEMLLPLGRQVHLEQHPRADRIGKELPKGSVASSTNKVAQAILAESGEQALAELVKLPEKIIRATRVVTGNMVE